MTEHEQRRHGLLYPFPVCVTILAAVSFAMGWISLLDLPMVWFVPIVGWIAWSTASGLYPWSMRP